MKKLLPLLFIFPMFCFAQSSSVSPGVQLTWEVPTSREDGSSLPVEEISGYLVNATINGVAQGQVFISNNTATEYFYPVPAGSAFEITLQTRDTDGLESFLSLTASGDIPGGDPDPGSLPQPPQNPSFSIVATPVASAEQFCAQIVESGGICVQ